MRNILILSTALLITAPAQAQLLGGGLGGTLGGSLGNTFSGMSDIGSPMDSIRSSTDGAARGTANTHGSNSIDRKSGHAHADRSANASGGGALAQELAAPSRHTSAHTSANGSASGAGSADATLLGTDAAHGMVKSARHETRSTMSRAGQDSSTFVGGAQAGTGSATGSAATSNSQSTGGLALVGSAAAAGDGAFSISKGAPVLSPNGKRIGKVRQMTVDGQGRVQELLVKVEGQTAALPAANFRGDGNAVVSAMSEDQIRQTARQQKSDGGKQQATKSN